MNAAADAIWHIGSTTAPLPPLVKGVPVVGNALAMGKDPMRFIVDMYHAYGPIFRIKLLSREITVLAGMDANRLATRHDEEVFTNEIAFAGLSEEVGPNFTAAPPAEHQYMRRLMRPAYSRRTAAQRIPDMVRVIDDFVDGLQPGDAFEVFPTLQELVVTQLGYIMLDQPPGEYFEDFRTFMRTMLEVHQFGTRPKLMLRLAAYRRARARSFEMARRVLDHTRQTVPERDRPENAIDRMLQATDMHGRPFDEAYLLTEALGPYLAGQDTVAGTLTFICYTIHKHPEVRARIEPEARAGFAGGMPTLSTLRQFETLHKTIVETMRRYPVAPFMPRNASQEFEFAGHRVAAGSAVYSATAVTHFLPEYYPDPWTFNIERERGPAGTFVPYGVGNYACLGAGIADVQLLISMAALLRRGRFELDPPGYDARIKTMPLPNPGRYRLKLVKKFD